MYASDHEVQEKRCENNLKNMVLRVVRPFISSAGIGAGIYVGGYIAFVACNRLRGCATNTLRPQDQYFIVGMIVGNLLGAL